MPNALRGAGYECEIHDDHFDSDTEDEVWLRDLAGRKWVVLTKDEKIRYRPLEITALRNAGLRVFVVICGNVTGAATAQVILRSMPKIIAFARRKRAPFLCYVYKDGTVRMK